VKTIILAIDGRCGSGKTRAASVLGTHFNCNVFHMDDFYLSESERQDKQAGFANADIERFEREVLQNIQKGEPFTYFKYLPESGKLVPVRVETPTWLNIVEGSYCTDVSLRKYYDVAVFLTAGTALREKRLIERGEDIGDYRNRWMVYEENFFKAQDTESNADVVIDTSGKGE